MGLRKLPCLRRQAGRETPGAWLLDRNLQRPKQTCSPLTADPPIIPYFPNPKAHALLTSNTSEIKPRVTIGLTLKDRFRILLRCQQSGVIMVRFTTHSILRSSQ